MGCRHVQAVRGLGLDLAGVCDVRREALDAVAAEFAVPPSRLFTSPHDLFRRARPEVVVVSTTADSHCDLTCLAAEAGARYVLCEKPMACSLEQCDRMTQACRRGGVTLAVNHPMRFMPVYTVPAGVVRSEGFGGLSSVTVVAGNVGVAMNGCHFFELLRYLTGERVAAVSAWFSAETVPNPRGHRFEDRGGSVRAVTEGGKRLYLEVGCDQGHGITTVYSGPYGQLVVDQLGGSMRLSVRLDEHRSLPSTRYASPSADTQAPVDLGDAVSPSQSVLRALLEGRGFPTGEEGRQAVESLVAAYVSAEGGSRPVRPLEQPLPAQRVFPWA
jgi:predicted dehydrogenase